MSNYQEMKQQNDTQNDNFQQNYLNQQILSYQNLYQHLQLQKQNLSQNYQEIQQILSQNKEIKNLIKNQQETNNKLQLKQKEFTQDIQKLQKLKSHISQLYNVDNSDGQQQQAQQQQLQQQQQQQEKQQEKQQQQQQQQRRQTQQTQQQQRRQTRQLSQSQRSIQQLNQYKQQQQRVNSSNANSNNNVNSNSNNNNTINTATQQTPLLSLHTKLTHKQTQLENFSKKLQQIQKEIKNNKNILNSLEPQEFKKLQNIENDIKIKNQNLKSQIVKWKAENQKIKIFTSQIQNQSQENINLQEQLQNTFFNNFSQEQNQNDNQHIKYIHQTFMTQNEQILTKIYFSSKLSLQMISYDEINNLSNEILDLIYVFSLLQQICIYILNKNQDCQDLLQIQNILNKDEIEKYIIQHNIDILVFSKSNSILLCLYEYQRRKIIFNDLQLKIIDSFNNQDFYNQIYQNFNDKLISNIQERYNSLQCITGYQTELQQLQEEKQVKEQQIDKIKDIQILNQQLNDTKIEAQQINEKENFIKDLKETDQTQELAKYEKELLNCQPKKYLFNQLSILKQQRLLPQKIMDVKYPNINTKFKENTFLCLIQGLQIN